MNPEHLSSNHAIKNEQHPINHQLNSIKEVPMNERNMAVPAMHIESTSIQNEQQVTSDFIRVKNHYKEIILLLKDSLDVTWKLAPLAFLPTSLFLWAYLRSIHWTEIFQDSAMSGTGLIFLFVATMLMAVAVVLQFVMPSLLLMCILSVYRQDRTVPKALPRLYRWAMGGWVAGWSFIIIANSDQIWILFGTTFFGAFLFAITHLTELELREEADRLVNKGKSALYALFLAAIAMSVMLATALPLIITFHAVEPYTAEGMWFGRGIALFVCLATVMVSLVPGYMYLNARTWKIGIFRPLKFGLFGMLALSYIVLACATFFMPISSTVLRLAHVYSNELQTFQIIQPNLIGAFSEAGLPMHQGEKITSVYAYVRYKFGGMRLLCRDSFVPETISDDAVKAARENKLPDPGIVAGSGCVPTSLGEVRPYKT